MDGSPDFSYFDYNYETLFESLLDPAVYVSPHDLERNENDDCAEQPGSSGWPSRIPKAPTKTPQPNPGRLGDDPAAQSRLRVRTQSKIVREWFVNHPNFPCVYASAEQKEQLALDSGLTIQQIRTCLTNLRARIPSSNQEVGEGDSECSQSRSTGITTLSVHHDFSLEANHFELVDYQCSPVTVPTDSVQSQFNIFFPDASLIGDIEHGLPQDEDSLKACLNEDLCYPSSPQNANAQASVFQKKGKRRHLSRSTQAVGGQSMSPASHPPSNKYHCTECPGSFKDKTDWRRHESGVHTFHSTEWICMLGGYILEDESCGFCNESFPHPLHFNQHNIAKCSGNSIGERTFYRKDGFKQHINGVHFKDMDDNFKKSFKIPDAWSKEVDASCSHPRSLWCGFCQKIFPSTAQRMEHVGGHFRDGMDMVDWKVMPTL
ncbi:hypothetical protein K491DRAFT_756449 [Lophiostoma macrostomum CBS 122681]|uniref:C2H2-type domain-containing protein n=1 Tax=Lophiostoma macrostomum CBS 122681 TaxID=1314788 RepID=A0A6A6TDE1_9PLEO|nr:hypothetical protein K491DRAFT_756449 [Lophiostoma macrostomum CBS 122681]